VSFRRRIGLSESVAADVTVSDERNNFHLKREPASSQENDKTGIQVRNVYLFLLPIYIYKFNAAISHLPYILSQFFTPSCVITTNFISLFSPCKEM